MFYKRPHYASILSSSRCQGASQDANYMAIGCELQVLSSQRMLVNLCKSPMVGHQENILQTNYMCV